MGKSTISMAIFNSFLLVHRRVYVYLLAGISQLAMLHDTEAKGTTQNYKIRNDNPFVYGITHFIYGDFMGL